MTREHRVRTKSNILSIFTGLVFIVLSSCADGDRYTRFHHIENGMWHNDSSLVFSIDSVSFVPETAYDVTIELTTNRSYPYRDIWLVIDQDLTGTAVRTDTLKALLANENGKWLGSGVGGLNQFSLPFLSFTPRDSTYHYRLTIRQGMHINPLRGVEKVGVKVVEANETDQKNQ